MGIKALGLQIRNMHKDKQLEQQRKEASFHLSLVTGQYTNAPGHEIPERTSDLRVTTGKSSSSTPKRSPSPFLFLRQRSRGKQKFSAAFVQEQCFLRMLKNAWLWLGVTIFL